MWFPSHGVASKVIFFRKKGGWKRDLGFSATSFFNFETDIKSQTLDIQILPDREGVGVFFSICFPGSKYLCPEVFGCQKHPK